MDMMSKQSIQSVSTPIFVDKRTKTDLASSKATVKVCHSETLSSLLTQSLAISLVKVEKGCGSETALAILEILQDDSFDISNFKKKVSSLKQCEDITTEIVGGPIG